MRVTSCYVRDTHCSRHLTEFRDFFWYREIREINVSRKCHVIRYLSKQDILVVTKIADVKCHTY